jgi:thiosulfate/3-mercaptopyruvate sulfurtransferase
MGAPGLLVVDVRDPDLPATTLVNGHIAGAVSAPFAGFGWAEAADGLPPEDLEPKLAALGIGSEAQVVLVADMINDFDFGKAVQAHWVLKARGHDAVTVLDGGEMA